MSLLNNTTQQKNSLWSIILYGIILIGIVFVPSVFYSTVQSPLAVPKIYLLFALTLTGIFVWLLQSVISKQFVLRRTSLDIPILVLLSTFVISSLFSVIPSVSFLGKMNVFVLHSAVFVSLIAWSWLLIQSIRSIQRWRVVLQLCMLVGVLQAIIFFVQLYIPIALFDTLSVQTIFTDSNSLLSIYFATIGIIAAGQLLPKHTALTAKLFPLLTACMMLAAVFHIGFSSGLIILAVGMALLTIIGITYLSEVYTGSIIALFSIFVAAILFLLFGVPSMLRATIPVEVGIGANATWDISQSTLLSSVPHFLLGTGPGTFLQSFSEFRDSAFNASTIAWTVRFNTPHNTFFAFLSELGVIGFITFIMIGIGLLSIILSAWNKTRPSTHSSLHVSTAADAVRIQVFVLAAAWIALTVGMMLSFFSISLWFIWWTIFALVITGIGALIPQIIQERRWSLEVSPQYSLIVSFGLIIVATGILVVGTFAGRLFFADVAYTKALRSSSIEETGINLENALSLRPQYVPYNLSYARLSLQRARVASQAVNPDADEIAGYLATAVNTAKKATDQQEKDVETWETLASMYLNAESLVPEANTWAKQALKRAIALEPTNPVFEWQLGNAELFSGNKQEAEKQYQTAIRLKPDYLVAYLSLSSLLASQNRFDQAIAVLEPISQQIKTNPDALFSLGRLYYNRNEEGDLQRAENVLVRAVELSPDFANARFSLGLVYEAKGNRAAAIEQYMVVQQLNPENKNIQEKLDSLK